MDKRTFDGWRSQLAVVVLFLAAFGFGLAGFSQYRSLGWADRVYRTLQLFTLDFEPGVGDTPSTLQVARFLAPAATVVAIIAAVSALLGRSIQAWWRRNVVRDHTIVVGESRKARMVALARQAAGARVYAVEKGDAGSLRRLGIRRAGAVFACEEWADGVSGDDQNLATAVTALSLRPRRLGANLFVHVSDLSLALVLRARSLMGLETRGVQYFNMDEVAAQTYIEGEVLDPQAEPRIVVAGATALGEAIVVAFARKWRDVAGTPRRIAVTLVDAHATAAREAWLQRWPIVAQMCEIVAQDGTFDAYLRLPQVAGSPPYRAYVCYDDDVASLVAALSADTIWPGRAGEVVVRLGQIVGPPDPRLGGFDARAMFDRVGPLRFLSVDILAAPLVAHENVGLVHGIAAAMHGWYLADQLAAGAEPGSQPALRRWEELPYDLKDANYRQARTFVAALRGVGVSLAPRSPYLPAFELSAGELERLAAVEHERWATDRKRAGWRYGPSRDNERQRHPHLVAWPELSEDERSRNREAVRALQAQFDRALHDIGLQALRVAAPERAAVATAG